MNAHNTQYAPRSIQFRFFALLFLIVLILASPIAPAAAEEEEKAVSVEVLDRTPGKTVLKLNFGPFEQVPVRIRGREFQQINLGSESPTMQKGFPAVPAIRRSVVLPPLRRMKVKVLESSHYDIQGIRVAPSKGSLKRTVDPTKVPYTFSGIYGRNAWYPAKEVEIYRPYIMRDLRGAVVTVNPFRYNPARKTLRVLTSITVAVLDSGPGRFNLLYRAGTQPDRGFDSLFANSFVNYDPGSSGGNRGAGFSEDGDMLILAPLAFHAALEPLVDWKNSRGIATTLVDVNSVGNSAAAIKSYIETVYNQSNLAYVLLVGDAGEVATPISRNGAADPTYALLAGNDHYPDIFVGRFSARTVDQVETQVTRTIMYEQTNAGEAWLRRGTGVASDIPGGHNGESDDEHMDNIRDDLLAAGYTLVDRIYDPSATASQVDTALNDGRGIVNYCGHGNQTSWGSSGFSVTHVNNLRNNDMLPFIVSVACLNGKFHSGDCFAEAWLRAEYMDEPSGAAAVYASSVNMYWQPPMTAQDEIVDLYTAGSMATFGALCYAGACRMMDDHGLAGQNEFDNWHVFGDPSLLVAMREEAFTFSFPDGIPELLRSGAATTVPVEITDGAENCLPATTRLHFRADPAAAFTEIPLIHQGGSFYEAEIPACFHGDSPAFYFAATGDGGTTIFDPADAPASLHEPEVGMLVPVIHDNFETNLGWTAMEENLTSGAWERVAPIGTTWYGEESQPYNDNPEGTGTFCWVTGQGVPGGPADDADVDGGPVSLVSPLLDISGGGVVSFYYHFYNMGSDDTLRLYISGDSGATWTEVFETYHNPGWHFYSLAVEEFVTPSSEMKLKFVTQDLPDNTITEAAVDDFSVKRLVADPSLQADTYALSASAGGVVTMALDAGTDFANRDFILLGTGSGVYPGSELPGSTMILPINFDRITGYIFNSINSPMFQNFRGTLDTSGRGQAILDTQGPITIPWLMGSEIHFAFAIGPPWNFTSTPIAIVVEP